MNSVRFWGRPVKSRSFFVRLFLLFVVALLVGCGLSGCKSDDTTVVSQKLESAIFAFKNSQHAEETKLIADNQNPLLGFGVAEQEAAASCLKHFGYEIGDVTIDGDRASATVHATNADFNAVMQAATQQALENAIKTKTQQANGPEIENMLSKGILDGMAAEDAKIVFADIVVNLTRNANEWTFDDPSQILQILFAGESGGYSAHLDN